MRNYLLVILLVLISKAAFPIVKQEAASTAAYHSTDSLIAKAFSIRLKDPASARKMAERALVTSKQINYRHGTGRSFYVIGISYWVQSYFSVSQFYLNMALPYLKGDNAGLVNCYKGIGRNYVDLKNYDQALYTFNKGLRSANNNTISKAEIYTELTSMYYAKGDLANCLRYIDTAMKYSRLNGRKQLIGILYNRLGQVYIAQNKIAAAENALDTSYQLNLQVKNRRLQAVLFTDKARIEIAKANFALAINYCNQSYALADTLGSIDLKLRALKTLTDIYKNQSNAAQANIIQQRIIQLYEGMDKVNNDRTLHLIQDYFTLNNKLNSIELADRNDRAQEALIKTQHRTIALLIVSLITALTLLVIIFIYYKQKNQMNYQLKIQHNVLLDQKKMIETQRTDLEDINKLKNKLLAIIGHDLRTPIASLSSIADMFAAEYITPKEIVKLMRDLTRTVKGAELTLANLMEFADSQIKGQGLKASYVNLFAIIEEMEETFRHQLQQKGIRFINDQLKQQTIWADANHIKVVLRNLISNAIKFTGTGGHIKVSSVITNNEMQICVEDTGMGMTLAELAKLFDVNHHFSQKGTMGEMGTGLGLLLCKELINLNNGKLWVNSTAGLGSSFYFTLPVKVNTHQVAL